MPEHEKKRRHYKNWLPFRTPTLVGCAMAVDKKHFFDIGAFDEDMKIWGGENIELAWRNWMCHGEVRYYTLLTKSLTLMPHFLDK